MRNPLLYRGAAPSSFQELARRVSDKHMGAIPFTEAMLQEAVQRLLEETHWEGRSILANRPRRGDLALIKGRSTRPHFVVELKRAAELSTADDMQGRGYAVLNGCPCIVTNGLQYRMVLARDRHVDVSVGRLPITVVAGEHLILDLGKFAPGGPNGALERCLDDLFSCAAEGPKPLEAKVSKLVARVLGKAASLPAAEPRPRGLLPVGRRQLSAFGAMV
jgi:hypothetical protein